MKKAVTLVLVILFSLTINAQKRKKDDFERMTVAQRVDLALKKMTLNLDLSSSQQNKIKPLLEQKITEREAKLKERKENKGERKKLTADERYAKMSEKLDKQIVFKAEMKGILNDKQYERFEKMATKRMHKKKQKMKHKKRKHQKEQR